MLVDAHRDRREEQRGCPCIVEQRDDPALRGRPVIVGAGVVLAASYEAKAFGVRTAMGGHQARSLCPQAIVVPPRLSAYSTASKDVFEVFRDTTPLVEPLSVDEAFARVVNTGRYDRVREAWVAMLDAMVATRPKTPIVTHTYSYPLRLGTAGELTLANIGVE